MITVASLLQEVFLPRPRRARRVKPGSEEGARLAREIASLPERPRLALALRVFESLSDAQIAAVLDLSETEVQGVLTEATQQVVERLERATPSPVAPSPVAPSRAKRKSR